MRCKLSLSFLSVFLVQTMFVNAAAKVIADNSGEKLPESNITIDVAKKKAEISPTMYGVFFEDINLSADGGLYPELVRNRSFEGSDALRYWKLTPESQSA